MVLEDEDKWFYRTNTSGFTGRRQMVLQNEDKYFYRTKTNAELKCHGAEGTFVMNLTLPNRNMLQPELHQVKCKDSADVHSVQAHSR